MTRCGFVAIAGRPNAGKSTLLNRLVGQRIAITSHKPQSTRNRVVGLVTDDTTQLVLLDTPGLLEPGDALHRSMRSTAVAAIREADLILHIADARDGAPPPLWEVAAWDGRPPNARVLVALNKMDALTPAARDALVTACAGRDDVFFISARTGEGLEPLLARLRAQIPEGPFHYPADDASTADLRFIVAEIVREVALEQLDDEVPHALACQVEEFRESRTPVYIRAVLYVERETQKRIVIGAGGERIREVGRRARARIEPLVGSQVYLDLWVKVLPNWRRDAGALRRLGYAVAEESDT